MTATNLRDASISAATLTLAHAAEANDEVEVPSTFGVLSRAARGSEPLVIDGAAGEGGGQILRTALTLSMLTGTPFVLERIRAGRKKSGLMRQHLTCVKAAAAISGAEVQGASLGSDRLVFRPAQVVGGTYAFDVGSAGSVCLVLQTIALPLALAAAPSRVVVRGGTHARWAPIYPFLAEAWLPLVREAGAEVTLELRHAGFYPAGGGEVVMTTTPSAALAPLHLAVSTGPRNLEVAARAVVAGISEGIARRELLAVAASLPGTPVQLGSASLVGVGPGNALWVSARDERSGITNVFSAIGELDVRAEDVGRSAAESFSAWRESGASLEPHLADQVMLPIALAGEGSFTCSALTLHARTNLEVIHAFTGRRFEVWRQAGSRFRLALTE